MSDQLKVHDRRLFTPDGELREEYRHLQDAKAPNPTAERREEEAAPEAAATAEKPSYPPIPEDVKGYSKAADGRDPTVLDLIGMLAEPASHYLREASMGRSGDLRAASQTEQNLQLAQVHIDLLSVLRSKTVSHLDANERHMLDDVITRLQTGFVQISNA